MSGYDAAAPPLAAAAGTRKVLEFGICGLDVTVKLEDLKELFKVPEACALDLVAAFQLAYQGYPWEPAKGYEKGSGTKDRRYEHGETYPAWFEIDAMIEALPGTKVSIHLNDSKEYRYVSGLLEGDEKIQKLMEFLCEKMKVRHIQINISSRGVNPELFTPPSKAAQLSAARIVELSERYPETFFLIPVFQRDDLNTLPFLQLVFDLSGKAVRRGGIPAPNLLAFFDNSAGQGKEPSDVPDLPADYPKGPVGFAGGIRADNVKDWLSKYHRKASAAGCWVVCDAQSGFRRNGSRGEPIDLEELRKLLAHAIQWGVEAGAET